VTTLNRKGFFVSIARRAGPREVKEGWRATILVVDDDPDLQKLFRMYLSLEGYKRCSGSRPRRRARRRSAQSRKLMNCTGISVTDFLTS